jgi:4-oxalocrotonate tautomerase
MPVIMIHTLELTEAQKKVIAKKYTEILSEATNVPADRVYVFFNSYPLDGISAGGMLNSELPDSVLKQFNIKYSADLIENEAIRVASRMKAKPGMEEKANKALSTLIQKTREEKGCLSYDLFRSMYDILNDQDNSSYFLLKEKWRDGEAIGFHCNTDYFKEFMAEGQELFDGAIEVTKRIESLRKNDSVDPSGQTMVLARVKAKPGAEAVVNNGMIGVMRTMDEKKSCKMYDLFQGFEGIYDPSVYFSFQMWDSFDDFNEARKRQLSHMPFSMNDMAEPREAVTYTMVSHPAIK